MIKHVEIGTHDSGPFKGLQFFKVTVEKNVNLDKATETVAKIQGVANLLIAGIMKGKKVNS